MRMLTDRTGSVRLPSHIGTGMAAAPRPEGLEIVEIFAGSSVGEAGLLEGDLIVAIDGIPVHERGCKDRNGVAGQRQMFSFIRDGIRTDVEVETRILIP